MGQCVGLEIAEILAAANIDPFFVAVEINGAHCRVVREPPEAPRLAVEHQKAEAVAEIHPSERILSDRPVLGAGSVERARKIAHHWKARARRHCGGEQQQNADGPAYISRQVKVHRKR